MLYEMLHHVLITSLLVSLSSSASVSPPDSCPCTPPHQCPWPAYGSHVLDIAVLGLHPPCVKYGEVRCCDKDPFKFYYGVLDTEETTEQMTVLISNDIEDKDNDEDTKNVESNVPAKSTNPAVRNDNEGDMIDNPDGDNDGEDDTIDKDDNCACLPEGVCPSEFIVQHNSVYCQLPQVLCCVHGYHEHNYDDNDKHKDIESDEDQGDVKEGYYSRIVQGTATSQSSTTVTTNYGTTLNILNTSDESHGDKSDVRERQVPGSRRVSGIC